MFRIQIRGTTDIKKVLTFSLSVFTSFLSSLFFSLPGASAVGMDEWKMKSFPLHSAAWRAARDGRGKKISLSHEVKR